MTDAQSKPRRAATVPSSRFSRMASLAGRVAGNLVTEV
jgi:hypothetical protein